MTNRPYYHYDMNRGWEETLPGWYEVVIEESYPSGIAMREYYLSILDWIEENIQGAIKHSRWNRTGGRFRFKFRYERDYMWFRLRWG